nr:TetR family transcriptional regulator [uncultured Acetatifactor sp.]
MCLLADSNITKRALSSAFKELLESRPFSKISIGDICEKCEMNRKSFYYHFKDKYDLVNWIYYTEFVQSAVRITTPFLNL